MERFRPWNARWSPTQTDWILPFRAALLGGVHVVETPIRGRRTRREQMPASKMIQLAALLAELRGPVDRAAARGPFRRIRAELFVHPGRFGGSGAPVRNDLRTDGMLADQGPRPTEAAE